MRPIPVLATLALLTAVLAGCAHTVVNDGDALRAAIDTSHGCILIEFFTDEAPLTVENFIQYAEDGFYENTIFHRIIPGFMVQGGGFTPDGERKQPRDSIPMEYNVANERGTMAMARLEGEPNSATSQFFINTVDNSQGLSPQAGDGHGYAVFARVVEGMEVADRIALVPTGFGPQGQENWPVDPPVIEGVRVEGECVSVPTEYVPFWVLNGLDDAATYALEVEAPEGWEVTLHAASADLAPGGQPGDAHANFLTLRGHEAGSGDRVRVHVVNVDDPAVNATLQVRGVASAPATGTGPDPDGTAGVMVGLMTSTLAEDGVWETVLSDEAVSAPGSQVTIAYVGSFDDGDVFDEGSFPTTVRGGQTVAGFDTGLLGIAMGETVHLRFPPDLGYGYNPPGHMQQFAGQWLNFEVTLESLS